MDDGLTFTIVLTVGIIAIASVLITAIYLNHIDELYETPYEQCLDECGIVYTEERMECLNNCNMAVENIIKDLTDSFDKFDWGEILK